MKIIYFCLIFIVLSSTAFSQQTRWQISDYLKNLPKKYKTFGGDNVALEEQRKTIIDNKNGYAAYQNPKLDDDTEPLTFFEIAKFNSQRRYPTIVATNYIYDQVCDEYQTFFLQKRGNMWVDVKSLVLPKIKISMFFQDSKTYSQFVKLEKKLSSKIGGYYMQFKPPRIGTKMEVKLVFCDYADDDVSKADYDDYQAITKKVSAIYLKWNKSSNKFEVAK